MNRTKRNRTRTRPGFTLIELLVSATLLIVVLGAVTNSTRRGLALFQEGNAQSELSARAGRALDRIVKEVFGSSSVNAELTLYTPDGLPQVWDSTFEFRRALDWVAGAVVWDETRRIALELAPGELDNDLDDNADGLVDEQSVVLTIDVGGPNQQRVVLVNDVRELLEGEDFNLLDDNGNGMRDEAGLCFSVEDGVLRIRLSLEKRGPNGLLVRTYQDVVRLRN